MIFCFPVPVWLPMQFSLHIEPAKLLHVQGILADSAGAHVYLLLRVGWASKARPRLQPHVLSALFRKGAPGPPAALTRMNKQNLRILHSMGIERF